MALDGGQILGTPPQQEGGGTYTGQYWQNLSNQLIPAADTTISGEISGNQTLGTRDHPQITVIEGETSFEDNVDGAGILIVGDEVEFSGDFHFEGLIIILGEGGRLELEDAGRVRLFGAVVVTGGGELEVELEGNARMMYSSSALTNSNNIDSLFNVVSWREVY